MDFHTNFGELNVDGELVMDLLYCNFFTEVFDNESGISVWLKQMKFVNVRTFILCVDVALYMDMQTVRQVI